MSTIQCLHCSDVFDPETFYGHVRNIVRCNTGVELAAMLDLLLDAALAPAFLG